MRWCTSEQRHSLNTPTPAPTKRAAINGMKPCPTVATPAPCEGTVTSAGDAEAHVSAPPTLNNSPKLCSDKSRTAGRRQTVDTPHLLTPHTRMLRTATRPAPQVSRPSRRTSSCGMCSGSRVATNLVTPTAHRSCAGPDRSPSHMHMHAGAPAHNAQEIHQQYCTYAGKSQLATLRFRRPSQRLRHAVSGRAPGGTRQARPDS